MLKVVLPNPFEKQLSKIVKKYPNSKNEINEFVKKFVSKNPLKGDRIPGFGDDLDVRKIRIGLKRYKISSRDGLRFIYLHQPERKRIIALVIYQKSTHDKEMKNKTIVISALRDFFIKKE